MIDYLHPDDHAKQINDENINQQHPVNNWLTMNILVTCGKCFPVSRLHEVWLPLNHWKNQQPRDNKSEVLMSHWQKMLHHQSLFPEGEVQVNYWIIKCYCIHCKEQHPNFSIVVFICFIFWRGREQGGGYMEGGVHFIWTFIWVATPLGLVKQL